MGRHRTSWPSSQMGCGYLISTTICADVITRNFYMHLFELSASLWRRCRDSVETVWRQRQAHGACHRIPGRPARIRGIAGTPGTTRGGRARQDRPPRLDRGRDFRHLSIQPSQGLYSFSVCGGLPSRWCALGRTYGLGHRSANGSMQRPSGGWCAERMALHDGPQNRGPSARSAQPRGADGPVPGELELARAAQKAVALAQQDKSTWTRADVIKYLGRVLPPLRDGPGRRRSAAGRSRRPSSAVGVRAGRLPGGTGGGGSAGELAARRWAQRVPAAWRHSVCHARAAGHGGAHARASTRDRRAAAGPRAGRARARRGPRAARRRASRTRRRAR